MSVIARNIAGLYLFEFECPQWSELDDEYRADWEVVTNSCGSKSVFGNPYASYTLSFDVYGNLEADAPIQVTTVDNVTTISIDPATADDPGSMSALDFQKAQTYLEPVSLNTTGASISIGTVTSITVVTALLAKEYRTGDIFSVINNSNGERVKLTVTADTTGGATTISVSGTSAYLIPSGAILVPIYSVRDSFTAGTGISISGGTITNTAPDQTVTLTNGGNVTITGTYPNFTLAVSSPGTGTVTSVAATAPAAGFTISGSPITSSGAFTFSLANDLSALEALSSTGIAVRTATDTWAQRTITAGTGISISNGDGVSGNPTVTNSAPDQTVTLTNGGNVTITGTYPNFTLSVASPGTGTVTNFSAGDLSPLFTTSEATTTTTPALTFALSNAAANTWFGNNTGSSAAPAYNASGALTKADDTNVTLTLGGSPTSALHNAVSITAGWTGTLAVSRGGIGVGTITGIMQGNGTSAVTGITNSSATGQVLRVTGASTYAWGSLDLANSSAVTGDLPMSNIVQGVARSVLGVAGNATADHADIQGTSDQVLRVTTLGTSLGFGQIATGGITDDAVTYAKLQNVSANNVVLGNILGANQNAQELTVANLYTLLGMSGTAGRNAYWSGTNTLSNSANWLWDNTNGRVTIIPQVAGLGGGAAALNINPPGAGTLASMEGLRIWGNINGNLMSVVSNTNTGASSAAISLIETQGDTGGDPILQFHIAGTGGVYTAVGLDNSDSNKFKITPNSAAPGFLTNVGLTMTQTATTLVGINKDNPAYELHVGGRTMSDAFYNTTNTWSSGFISFGTGAGTGPSISSISGGANWMSITFTTGTSPAANGNIFTGTYPQAFPAFPSYVVFSASNANAATDHAKFYMAGGTGGGFNMQANGTLTASTQYKLDFHFGGTG